MQAFTFDNHTIELEMFSGRVLRSKRPGERAEGIYWIKAADGTEQDIVWHDPDLSLRAGEEVTLIFASGADTDITVIVALRNHCSALTYLSEDGESLYADLIPAKAETNQYAYWTLFIALGGIGYFVGKWFVGAGLVFFYVQLYYLIPKKAAQRKKQLISQLQAHIARLDRQVAGKRMMKALSRSA